MNNLSRAVGRGLGQIFMMVGGECVDGSRIHPFKQAMRRAGSLTDPTPPLKAYESRVARYEGPAKAKWIQTEWYTHCTHIQMTIRRAEDYANIFAHACNLGHPVSQEMQASILRILSVADTCHAALSNKNSGLLEQYSIHEPLDTVISRSVLPKLSSRLWVLLQEYRDKVDGLELSMQRVEDYEATVRLMQLMSELLESATSELSAYELKALCMEREALCGFSSLDSSHQR